MRIPRIVRNSNEQNKLEEKNNGNENKLLLDFT